MILITNLGFFTRMKRKDKRGEKSWKGQYITEDREQRSSIRMKNVLDRNLKIFRKIITQSIGINLLI